MFSLHYCIKSLKQGGWWGVEAANGGRKWENYELQVRVTSVLNGFSLKKNTLQQFI